jgi:hypothetical protein
MPNYALRSKSRPASCGTTYAAVVGVGTTREEGLRRANLAADYVRTSPVIAEPFTNPPGYNSLSANIAMLKAGGKRGGFVRAFSVLAGQSNSWVDRTLPDLALN